MTDIFGMLLCFEWWCIHAAWMDERNFGFRESEFPCLSCTLSSYNIGIFDFL